MKLLRLALLISCIFSVINSEAYTRLNIAEVSNGTLERSARKLNVVTSERVKGYFNSAYINFSENYCYGQSNKCTDLFNSKEQLDLITSEYLGDVLSGKKKITSVYARLAKSIGSSASASGLSDIEKNMLIGEVSSSGKENLEVIVSSDTKRFCLDHNDKSKWQVSLDGQNVELHEIMPINSPRLTRNLIEKSISAPVSESYLRVRISNYKNVCENSCLEALEKEVVKAIATWRNAYIALNDNATSVIGINDSYYMSDELLYDTKKRGPDSNPLISTYSKKDKKAICSLPKGEGHSLCSKVNNVPELRIDLTNQKTKCDTDPKNPAIACAKLEEKVSLRIDKYQFKNDDDELVFGAGNREVNLSLVLLHEIGHWYGNPHLINTNTTPNIMSNLYDEKMCLKANNLSVLNASTNANWKGRLESNLGLFYEK